MQASHAGTPAVPTSRIERTTEFSSEEVLKKPMKLRLEYGLESAEYKLTPSRCIDDK
jgi:hypothetical protein